MTTYVDLEELNIKPDEAISNVLPPAMIEISDEDKDRLLVYVREWIQDLKVSHNEKLEQWAKEEIEYRAKFEGDMTFPFVGASGITVPLIAMGVDPVFARLDTGIFKGDRVFVLRALRKSLVDITPGLELWLHFTQRHKLRLRENTTPSLLEMCKHGTMVLSIDYDAELREVLDYDENWKVVKKTIPSQGVVIKGVSIKNFMFPPRYQHLQDCPIVAEKFLTNDGKLRAAAKQGKLVNVEEVLRFQGNKDTNVLDSAREDSAQHRETGVYRREYQLWRIWCDFDIDGDGIEEKLSLIWDESSETFLQIRLNWFFHQLKPYVLIPYITSSDTLYGLGLGEMLSTFQTILTRWERMAENNAYLANTIMYVTRTGVVKEDTLRVYGGRNIKVADPLTDIKPLRVGDTYNSTIQERQNIIGLAEKRTGISDYLTGRESPIVGSRATATSTVALIQEGTRRVEQVLENLRVGLADAIQMAIYLWIQFGVDPVTDVAFENDDVAEAVHTFFNTINRDNIDGAIAIDLSATDAANNKQVQQQTQLALIQVMMSYLQKVMEAGQMALGANNPVLTEMVTEVLDAARTMFRDLLNKYDIPNADMYLPDLEKFLGRDDTRANGVPGQQSMGIPPGTFEGPEITARTGTPNGNGPGADIAPAGASVVDRFNGLFT